jgi:hypothetical protein
MSRPDDREARDEITAFSRYAEGEPSARLSVLGDVLVARGLRRRAPMPRLGLRRTKSAPPPEPEESAAPSSEKVADLSWIEVQVVDENGAALAGARYKAELPDGSSREGKLDRSGRLRLDGIPAGDCKVRFPDLDKSAA